MATERPKAARALLTSRPHGVLSTHSVKKPGFPFGSIAPYALDAKGRPVFLLSGLAVHTKNLLADPRASLFVAQDDPAADPVTLARVNVFGHVVAVPEEESGGAEEAYLTRHPGSAQWAGFGDFRYYRLEPVDVYYVGGFGEMGWVSAVDFMDA